MVRLFAFLQVVYLFLQMHFTTKSSFAATTVLCNNLKFKGVSLLCCLFKKRTSLAHNLQMGTNELDEIKKLFEF